MPVSYLIDLFVHFTSDDLGACRIRRKNRPCLACEQSMDLVEITQSVNLLFIPICFNTKTMSFLDCPGCGFSSTLESYEYLRICQQKGEQQEYFIDGEQSIACRTCRTKMSQQWQYCPTCGAKHMRSLTPTKRISFQEEVLERSKISDGSFHSEGLCGLNMCNVQEVFAGSSFDEVDDLTDGKNPATDAMPDLTRID